MSYILDALRRADAERERDPARGIHAQPAAGVPAHARARIPVWAWPAAGLLLVGVVALATWQRTAPVASAPPGPVPAPVATAAVPAAAAVMPPAPPPVVVERVRIVAAPMAAAPAAKPAAPTATVATAAAAAVAAPQAAVAVSAVPAADRILNLAELPPDVQRELPKLAITGGVYSENAAQRMLIVGGQVFNEGAELAHGVVLDQIRPRAAVLRYRGYRYSVTY